jgi:hypothetical protein
VKQEKYEEILEHEIPDDIDLFFAANKYNL